MTNVVSTKIYEKQSTATAIAARLAKKNKVEYVLREKNNGWIVLTVKQAVEFDTPEEVVQQEAPNGWTSVEGGGYAPDEDTAAEIKASIEKATGKTIEELQALASPKVKEPESAIQVVIPGYVSKGYVYSRNEIQGKKRWWAVKDLLAEPKTEGDNVILMMGRKAAKSRGLLVEVAPQTTTIDIGLDHVATETENDMDLGAEQEAEAA